MEHFNSDPILKIINTKRDEFESKYNDSNFKVLSRKLSLPSINRAPQIGFDLFPTKNKRISPKKKISSKIMISDLWNNQMKFKFKKHCELQSKETNPDQSAKNPLIRTRNGFKRNTMIFN